MEYKPWSINLGTPIVMRMSIKFVNDLPSNEEAFLQDFIEILKSQFQNLWKI